MNALKLTGNSAATINELLADLNGQATTHTFTHHSEVTRAATRGHHHVLKYLSKKDAQGAQFRVYSSGPVAKCYKQSRIGNKLTFEIGANGNAFLIKVEKVTLWPSGGGDCCFDFTLAQKDAIMAKALANATRD